MKAFLFGLLAVVSAINAAPMCIGSIRLSELTSQGCEIAGTTFSSFSLDYSIAFPSPDALVNQDNILVEIGPGRVIYGLFDSAPAYVVTLRPDPASGVSWTGGFFRSTSFGISFQVDSSDFRFVSYQARGADFSAFRNNGESVTVNPTGGTGPAIQGNFGGATQFGFPPSLFGSPVSSFSTTFGVFVGGGLFSAQISEAIGVFQVTPVPEPALTLPMLLAGLGLASRWRRKKK